MDRPRNRRSRSATGCRFYHASKRSGGRPPKDLTWKVYRDTLIEQVRAGGRLLYGPCRGVFVLRTCPMTARPGSPASSSRPGGFRIMRSVPQKARRTIRRTFTLQPTSSEEACANHARLPRLVLPLGDGPAAGDRLPTPTTSRSSAEPEDSGRAHPGPAWEYDVQVMKKGAGPISPCTSNQEENMEKPLEWAARKRPRFLLNLLSQHPWAPPPLDHRNIAPGYYPHQRSATRAPR